MVVPVKAGRQQPQGQFMQMVYYEVSSQEDVSQSGKTLLLDPPSEKFLKVVVTKVAWPLNYTTSHSSRGVSGGGASGATVCGPSLQLILVWRNSHWRASKPM